MSNSKNKIDRIKKILNLVSFVFLIFFPISLIVVNKMYILCLLFLYDMQAMPMFTLSGFVKELLCFLAFISIPIIATSRCYYWFIKKDTWWKRWIDIYVCWLILSYWLAYQFAVIMSGVNMAYVEGFLRGWGLVAANLEFATFLVLIAHIFILPWTFLVIFLMKKFKKQHITSG